MGSLDFQTANSQQMRLVRLIFVFSGVAGLITVFLFQQINLAAFMQVEDNRLQFLINRSIRFILNDAFSLLIISGIFFKRKYIWVAIMFQILGLLFILIPYLSFKWWLPSYNGPLISFLHRLVLNPVLLFLLIPSFLALHYQQVKSDTKSRHTA